MLFLLDSVDSSIMEASIRTPPWPSIHVFTGTWSGAMTTRKSASPSGTMGLKTRSPNRTSLETDPPRWLIPCNSLFFTSMPALKATSARMSEALITPCPPSPAITTFVGLPLAMLVGWLLIAPLVLADPAVCQQTVVAGDHHGELRTGQAVLNRLLKFLRLRCGIDYIHIAYAQRARQLLEDHLARLRVGQRAPSPRMLLQACHGRGSVVQNHHHMTALRRVVYHLDQTRNSAVYKGAVADDAHHALRR